MLFTKINAYQKGLVLKKGRYVRMLDEGSYLKAIGEEVLVYNMATHMIPPIELNLLLQHEELKEALFVVDVKDNCIALLFENGVFKSVLTTGRYVYWKGVVDRTCIYADLKKVAITENIEKAMLAKAELQPYVRSCTVEPNEKALLYIDGKLEKVLDSGVYYFWKNNTSIVAQRADIRQQQMEISGQEILTKDKATLRLSFFARYTITDILKALKDNKEYDKQLYIMMQMAMREYIGSYTLDELLEKKNDIAPKVIEAVADKAAGLGITIAECGIRDIILPGDMKDIMNQVMIAEKKAQANIIMRREETASMRSLLNTAKLMEENQMLFKLKEMEYVEKIADKISNISVSGSGDIVSQLKQIFVPR